MISRKDAEKKEEKYLANYAAKNSQSKGRVHKENEHPYRTAYQRDKDRITYSTAFRRLQYKTQVFVNYEGDHYRTRLTHTLEVTQIARTIARALGLNEDLVEAIALAHDIGHTPFGHSGEKALNEMMKKNGGFEHNLQALRIVDYLEEKHPDFKGLNLSWEVREGIIKHKSIYDTPRTSSFNPKKNPSLEAQVVNVADEIAYNNHDLDDGITSGLISMENLDKIKIWKLAQRKVNQKYRRADEEAIRHLTIREMINYYVSDLIEETNKKLKMAKITSSQKAINQKKAIVTFSPVFNKQKAEAAKFLYDNLYMHPHVIRMSDKSTRFLHDLFKIYIKQPALMPQARLKYLKRDGKYRVICDYMAGMTDRYALDEYKKLFDPYERV